MGRADVGMRRERWTSSPCAQKPQGDNFLTLAELTQPPSFSPAAETRAASEFYSFCRKWGKDCFGLHDWLLRCCNPFPKASRQITWCQLKWRAAAIMNHVICSSTFENAATVSTAIELRSSCLSDSFFLEVSTLIFPLVGFHHSNDVAWQYMQYCIRVEDSVS